MSTLSSFSKRFILLCVAIFMLQPIGVLSDSQGTDLNKKPLVRAQFNAEVSQGLDVRPDQILWELSNESGEAINFSGFGVSINVPEGQYSVLLTLGDFYQKKDIHITEKQRRFSIKAEVGRLQLSSSQAIDWQLTQAKQNLWFSFDERQGINRILPAGNYDIKLSNNGVVRAASIQVPAGGIVSKQVNLPKAELLLMATLGGTPLLQPMRWQIFRSEALFHRQYAEYFSHSKFISLPPGKYRVMAQFGEQTHKQDVVLMADSKTELAVFFEPPEVKAAYDPSLEESRQVASAESTH